MKNLNAIVTFILGVLVTQLLNYNEKIVPNTIDPSPISTEITTNTSLTCEIGNDGNLGIFSNIEEGSRAEDYITTYRSNNPGQIYAMNISNRLIQALIDEHNRQYNLHDGYRVYYGERNEERVAILRPMIKNEGRLMEIKTEGNNRIVRLEDGAQSPCPMLCDKF